MGKDPGYSPESLIAEIRRNARYRADDHEALATAEPIDAGATGRHRRRSAVRCSMLAIARRWETIDRTIVVSPILNCISVADMDSEQCALPLMASSAG